MKSLWRRYLGDPFAHAMVELPWFGPVFSGIVVAFVVNLLTTWLTEIGGAAIAWPTVALLAGLTVAFVIAYHQREVRRRGVGIGAPIDLPNPKQYKGLVFLFSRADTLREAINYHRPQLLHCWLIVTPHMQARAMETIGQITDVRFSIHALENHFDTEACYRAVRHIFQEEAPQQHIAPSDIIADMTGGTKPMTAGLLVACLEGEYALEHIPTRFDSAGNPTGPLPPIQILLHRRPR
jgi:hypothetical protein